MYILRAYQSPSIGAPWGPQCDQMPNLASRNQFGQRYFWSDSHVGSKAGDFSAQTALGATARPPVIALSAVRLVSRIVGALLGSACHFSFRLTMRRCSHASTVLLCWFNASTSSTTMPCAADFGLSRFSL